MIFDGQEYDEASLPPLAQMHVQKIREIQLALNKATIAFVESKTTLEALSYLQGHSEDVIRRELQFAKKAEPEVELVGVD